MSKMLKVRNVNDYSRYLGCKEHHPLVSVIDRLGFEYPQHFSRMFKKQEGVTPSEYSQRVRG